MQPKISVVMPLYNEEQYIADTVRSLARQDYPAELTEWVFVDGASTDRSVETLRQSVAGRENVQILENPARMIPSGMNIGIQAATGEFIVRMDAHTLYAEDYISTGIRTILETGADCVGGPMVAAGKTPKQQAIAAALHSSFALGGGDDHDESYEGETHAVYYGIYRREYAIALGLYDEKLLKSEDDDFFFRMRAAGGKIYITPRIRMTYFPRQSFSALWRQYFEFGYWKLAFICKHHRPVKLFQMVPAAFVLYLVLGAALTLWNPLLWVYLGILALYLLLDLAFSLKSSRAHGFKQKCMLFWAHFVIHLAYGLGGWKGVFSCRK